MRYILLILVMLVTVTAFSQSFHAPKMKKANKAASEHRCEAVQPRKTFVQSVNQRLSYQQKRAQYRKSPYKRKKPRT